MNKLLLAVLIFCAPYTSWAQGWPENYSGVMLQGFYWDSYEDTKWSNMESKIDEYSKYFNLIWVPQSGYCNTLTYQMGYAPVWWFDHKSAFGTEQELRSMIAAYKAKNVGIIEDVVINHRSGNTNWCDFPTETWNGHTMTWSLADICKGDDGGKTERNGYNITGANDTGDDFDGSRDLDHTRSNVQQNVKIYLDFLLQDLGYAGFRYDMVKGYSPHYIGMYNDSSKPEFSVGEYWDADYNNVAGWVNGTNYGGSIRSAAFDFPLKYGINACFGSNNWDISNKGMAGSTSGMNRYAVTFVDNHDTYRDGSRLTTNVLAANAFILALPGTPCIFLPHWKNYKAELGKMILARKAAGITNQSNIVRQEPYNGGYVTVVQGQNAQVLVISGFARDFDTTGFTEISHGDNYAYYVSNGIDVSDILAEGQPATAQGEVKIHVSTTAETAPYLYAWDAKNNLYAGNWPGTQLTETHTTADGKTWYDWTSDVTPVNIIFNSGNNQPQTDNIMGVSGERYYTIDPSAVTNNKFGYNDVTSAYIHPGYATYVEGKTFAYFEAPAAWGDIKAWAWKDNDNFTGGSWPGTQLQQVGTASNGNKIYRWIYDGSLTSTPASVIFNDKQGDSGNQTATFEFVNGGYYNANGLLYTVSQPSVEISSAGYATYSSAQALDFTLAQGLTAYIVTSNNGTAVQLEKIEKVPAHTGVVLKAAPGKYTLTPTTEITDDVSENLLKATSLTGEVTTDGSYYVLASKTSNGVGFYRLENNKKVYKDRAYLTYSTPGGAKEFFSMTDDETTSIQTIQTPGNAGNSVYTLTGVRLNRQTGLPKGIYIINGKKQVVK